MVAAEVALSGKPRCTKTSWHISLNRNLDQGIISKELIFHGSGLKIMIVLNVLNLPDLVKK